MATEVVIQPQHDVVSQQQSEEFDSSSSFRVIPVKDELSSGVAEDQIEITAMYSDEENERIVDNISAIRDTSDVTTHCALNDTRESAKGRKSIAVNTYDSILDLESQGGDDDISFCDDDMMGILNLSKCDEAKTKSKTKPKTKSKRKVRAVSPYPSTNNNDDISKPMNEQEDEESGIMSMTLYNVTDSFVDSICTSTACVVSDNYYVYTNRSFKKDKSAFDSMDGKISKFQQSCPSGFFGSDEANRSDSKESEQSSKAMVSLDIWQLLGCSNSPGESELESIWTLRTPPEMLKTGGKPGDQKNAKQPVRASIKKRMKRIHRLRMDDRRISGASRHGVTITNHCIDTSYRTLNNIRNDIHMNKNNINHHENNASFESHQIGDSPLLQPSYRAIDKSYSMLDDPLEEFIGKGMIDPIPVQVEDGYDSDPEVNCYSMSSSMVTDSPGSQLDRMDEDSSSVSLSVPFPLPSDIPQHHGDLLVNPIPTDETEMRESVQQTLNSTWTLTWHPNAENRKEYNITHSKPICVNMWLERGAVMTNSGIVVEPAFMWRDAYQPLLLSQHKLNTSSQKPWSMRLLNACRITPYFSSPNEGVARNTLDRNKYPLARTNASFLLKSCDGEEFLLEAKSSEDAIAITERWKLVVARFACLAVTEDVGGIAREFFHPNSDSKMLTVPDPNNVF